jgi:uncharacterized membrane protein YuzA (DUF378 family)
MKPLLLHLPHLMAAATVNCLNGDPSCDTGLPTINATSNETQQILQVLFGILAVIAILFVVIGGLRFVLSRGNPEDSSKARSTIIYALVGLAIALSAEGLITFVLDKL